VRSVALVRFTIAHKLRHLLQCREYPGPILLEIAIVGVPPAVSGAIAVVIPAVR
jgi:hypothetical protein